MSNLKKVIITNFKTFLGRHEIEFPEKGLSVLIGPCGSGKSNILDAILFAMGIIDERRKQTVLEVITQEHETHNQLANSAEVELIFENLDGVQFENENKLIISRQLRIPSSGQFYSIYKMNGKESTKSEILKTLYKFGIQPDGYNIIKQGEISTRMKDTPESRKQLIEIVSGLSEFDPMIIDAESKIENARNNLKQIDLLLKESKRQLSELDKERERALEYKKLESKFNQLKGLKIQYRKFQYLADIDNLKLEIGKIQKIIQEVESESNELFQSLKKNEQLYEELRSKITELEKKRSSLTGHAKSIDEQIREIELEIKQNEEKHKYQKRDRKDVLLKEINKLESKRLELSSKMEDNVKKNNKIQREVREVRDVLEKYNKELPELQSKNKAILLKMSNLKDEINKQTRLKDKIDKEIGELRIRKDQVDSKFEEISVNLERKNRKVIQINSDLNSMATRKSSYTRSINSITKFFQESLIELKDLEKNQPILNRDLEDMRKLLEKYKEQMKSLKPRYSSDVKLILKGRDNGELPGLIGTILDLINIKEINPDYAKAIEAAVGDFFEHLVAENFDASKKIVEYVKEKDLGKITVYLYDKIKGWDEKELPNIPGIINKLINLINFKAKYRQLLSFVFKDTVLVQDLETAYKIHENFRAVTLNGEVIEPKGYIITQGKFEPKFLLLSEYYKVKIKELEESISVKNKELESINRKINKIYIKRETETKRKDELNRSIGQIDGKKEEILNIKDEVEQDIQDLRHEINILNDNIVDYQVEIQNKQMDLANAFNELEALKSDKIKLDEELKKTEYGPIEKKIRENNNTLKKLRKEVRDLEKKRSNYRNQIVDIDSSIKIYRERYNNSIAKIDELDKEKNSLERRMDELLSKMESQNTEIAELYIEIQTSEKQQKKLQDEIELKKEEESFKINQISKLNEKIHSLNNTIARKEAFIEESENKLDEMGIKLDEIQKIDIEKVNSDIYSLDNQMKIFGLVDPTAPEKYERENLKYEERIAKEEIYTNELEEAMNTFSDLIEQKKNKFLKTLQKINVHLKKIFNYFYKDGHAKLIPQNVKDPLNSGIEIEVDLGSGKINNIKSLSGGETSLVAISVILAIQEFEGKSAPFYFLDELDAHLDNTKGEKLAHLIAKMAENHQYIIVTPKNKYLAKLANRVFGLTKNDKGFSSLQYISQKNFVVQEA
ncbi:MAG: ATP-binding protein [Candidatus Hodarchaeota archaeon]